MHDEKIKFEKKLDWKTYQMCIDVGTLELNGCEEVIDKLLRLNLVEKSLGLIKKII